MSDPEGELVVSYMGWCMGWCMGSFVGCYMACCMGCYMACCGSFARPAVN